MLQETKAKVPVLRLSMGSLACSSVCRYLSQTPPFQLPEGVRSQYAEGLPQPYRFY